MALQLLNIRRFVRRDLSLSGNMSCLMNRHRHQSVLFSFYVIICLFSIGYCLDLQSSEIGVSRSLVLSNALPTGHVIVQLGNHTGSITIDARSKHASFFTIDQSSNSLVTTQSLVPLTNRGGFLMDLILRTPLTDGNTLQRVESFYINVVAEHDRILFANDLYVGRLRMDAPARTLVPGLERISLKASTKADNVNFKLLDIEDEDAEIESPLDELIELITVRDPYDTAPYVQIWTKRKLEAADRGTRMFAIQVDGYPVGNRDQVRVQVRIGDDQSYPPVFVQRRYLASIAYDDAPMGSTILRVRAFSGGGIQDATDILGSTVTYAIEPADAVPFDIDPFTGDIFATARLSSNRYSFDVIAREGFLSSRTPVKIIVVRNSDSLARKADEECETSSAANVTAFIGKRACDETTIRYKRALRPEISMSLPENYPTQAPLPERIRLGANERIKDAPVEKDQLTVFDNGTIHLNQPLNYEREKLVQLMVMVENVITLEDSPQRIVINVEDVDEKPRFINEPAPYLAVVKPETFVGSVVFTFQAVDEQGDLLDDPYGVGYQQINAGDGASGHFKVDALGRVKTLQKSYRRGENFQVYVQAYDKNPKDPNAARSEIAILHILVGERPPQFYQERYTISVSENTPIGASVAAVKAKSFDENNPVKYDLFENTAANSMARNRTRSDTFTIDEKIGVIHLRKELDYDSGQQPRSYSLKAVATSGSLTSEVAVEIRIADVNDHDPVFSQPLYTATVKEDIPIGQKILQVSAKDRDSGRNAAIRYYVDNNNFTVNDDGIISARVRLDADQKQQGHFIYRFTVTARDRGDPPRSTTSQVQIKTENVNDEAPIFVPTSQYTEYVAEDAQGNTPIVTIQAQDPDRDQVKYYFFYKGARTMHVDHFEIDSDTGVIKLRDGVQTDQLKQKDLYQLSVIAVDDGACCKDHTGIRHTSTATVRIGVKDVNNNKPVFRDCASYSKKAKIPEGKHKNYAVIKVEATDDDSGQNGDIVYSLYYPQGESRRPFIIEPTTGVLNASPYVEFDREERPFEDVTVKATDRGDRPLIGFCHFTVTVVDENDNAPLFDRNAYQKTISRSMPIGQSVLTVFADDRDAPDNARVTYELAPDLSEPESVYDLDFFKIRKDGGEIMLVKSLPLDKIRMAFLVVASDSGIPPKKSDVKVTIEVAEAAMHYPIWRETANCSTNISRGEDTPVNSIFAECYAESGMNPNNPISYSMRNGAKAETNSNGDFREFLVKKNGKDWVTIRNLKALDYEKIKRYDLTITATDMHNKLSKDRTFVIHVLDRNDNVPKFDVDLYIGSVDEEMDMANVTTSHIANVFAKDNDREPAFTDITYSILPGPSSALFRINPKTGHIYALKSFDREQTDSFILDVQAEDGAVSSLPGVTGPNYAIVKVQIHVSDINDNKPFFNQTLYEGVVRENAIVGQNVLTVKAHDLDKYSQLKYSLAPDGNRKNKFAVGATSGSIYVNDQLDFEEEQEYELTLYVTDGLKDHQAETKIHISIQDVNDNSPTFTQNLYSATLQEEDRNLPKPILNVTATDEDKDEASRDIVYRLVGQGANKEFTINEKTGQIYVNEPLDRDPPNGSEQWNFVVHAIDNGGQGLIGYADVQVTLTDINDNAPYFEGGPHTGYIEEGQKMVDRPLGVYVMTMTATDNDDPRTPNAKMTYEIVRNKYLNNTPVFRIEPNSGKLYAMVELDRENPAQKQFEIEVKATDHGDVPKSGIGKAIIKVQDINDNPPYFDNARPFESSVKETIAVNFPVMSLSAKDPDDEAFDNVLQYSLLESGFGDLGTRYFYITTDPDSSGSNVGTIRVKQPLDYEDTSQRAGFNLTVRVTDGRYFASAPVRLTLLDQNDNAPKISPAPIQFLREDVPVGTNVTRFTATDPDLRGQERVEFRINRTTDPRRQFFIGPTDGILKVAKPLDRENTTAYRLVIEAVDEANNVGHTILVVNVEDVNDNAPELNESKPVIPENKAPVLPVALVTAFDRDTPENGPPFFMSVPANSTYLDKFNFVFLPDADNGRGAMNISTKVMFDRERDGKELKLPIYVRDNGKPQMGMIRYFTVTIGDENDSPMSDGYSVIQVYNYNGKMPVTAIGRAYVEDLDDWDIVDKTFEWKVKAPDGFSLTPDGMITIDPLSTKLSGEYDLQIAVTDHKRSEKATASVKVFITNIKDQAFNNAGSMRIKYVEAEDFIRTFGADDSQYNILRQFLAEKIGVPKTNVDIFSVMSEGTHPPIIQVYFAVRGSAYKPATYLNGIVSQNRYELENVLGRGVQIIQVNVDDCIYESCEYGCERVVNADIRPTVLNANQTSLVGVTTTVLADCGHCAVPAVPKSCSPNPCRNGGLCHATDPGVFCECRGDFHGPFCEGRMRTFGGNSYAWLDPIKPCTQFHLRFEFMTTSNNALLLYDGPMSAARPGDITSTDFIALEILNNKPALLLNLGHGGIFARMHMAPDVNDGEWHRIDIVLNAQAFTLTLDGCSKSSMAVLNGKNNLTDCQLVGSVPNDYEQLNIVDPLQVGGLVIGSGLVYPSLNVTNGIDGCIRNIFINEILQDLGSPPIAVDSGVGCSKTDKVCMAPLEPQCVHGLCVSSMNDHSYRCVCDPGYVGDRCDQKMLWRNFEQSSYISYNFLDTMPLSATSMNVRMLIAPRQPSGMLLRGTSVTGNGNVQIELNNLVPTYRNYMGTDSGRGALAGEEFSLPLGARINASKPYLIEVQRELSYVKISVDGMPSPWTAASYEKNPPIDLDRKRYYVGADTENPQQPTDFQGCIAQINYDDLPIPVSQSDPQTYAVVTGQKAVSDGCPDIPTCASLYLKCAPPYICMDFWKGPFCTCPSDLKPVFNDDGDWIGCGEQVSAIVSLGITNGAVAAILICLLVLLILVVLLVVYSRSRRDIRQPSPYSDVRENIINYAEEGGGEEDQDRYNIAPLRKPVLPTDDFRQQQAPPLSNGRPTTPPDANMEDLIRDRLRLADTDPTAPPYDELRAYADEDAMSVGSLSSLSSDEEDEVEWNALNNWGPRFRKLAELYGGQD